MAVIPEEVLRIKTPATEETLQSIDSTLKRIEEILAPKHEVLIDGTSIFHQENHD